MSHQIDPPSYPEGDPLPECSACHERSYYPHEGRCLNPDCPSHSACEGCGKAEAPITVFGVTPLRLCLACGLPVERSSGQQIMVLCARCVWRVAYCDQHGCRPARGAS